MDVEQYIENIVKPTIEDFERNPTSVRHAFLACVATFHCIDYIHGDKSTQYLRDAFRQKSAEFALIDRIAHAFKHAKTGHKENKYIKPLDAKSVISRPPELWGTAIFGLSCWGDSEGGVTVKDEIETDVIHALKLAIHFIAEQCKYYR